MAEGRAEALVPLRVYNRKRRTQVEFKIPEEQTPVPLRVYYRKLSTQVEFNIPEELVIEILKRLPVDSLIRCMCVSKSWYSLITNPSFVSTHLSNQSDQVTPSNIWTIYQASCRFFLHRLHQPLDQWTEVDSPIDDMGVVVGCCHGVVCLFDYSSNSMGPVILWNPSVRKALTLRFDQPSGIRINNSGSPNFTIGFGFDPVSNDYKVVRLVYNWQMISSTTYVHCDVCSLNKDGWRSSLTLIEGDDFRLECRGVYLNGVIHWMCTKKHEGAVISKTVLTFDLASEKLGELCLPMNMDPQSFVGLMLVNMVEDKLAISCSNSGGYIWAMEEYGKEESWRRQLSLYLGENVGLIRGAIITGDGKVVLATSAGNWISWDSTNDIIENLALPVLEPDYMNAYVPSLVLLRCKNRKLRCKEIRLKKRYKRRMTAREFSGPDFSVERGEGNHL